MLFFFFLINDWYILIPVDTAQSFNLIAESVISIRIPRKEAIPEIEIKPVIAEARIRNCLI